MTPPGFFFALCNQRSFSKIWKPLSCLFFPQTATLPELCLYVLPRTSSSDARTASFPSLFFQVVQWICFCCGDTKPECEEDAHGPTQTPEAKSPIPTSGSSDARSKRFMYLLSIDISVRSSEFLSNFQPCSVSMSSVSDFSACVDSASDGHESARPSANFSQYFCDSILPRILHDLGCE